MAPDPDCGNHVSPQDTDFTIGKPTPGQTFTIRNFIIENFRLFTIIGTTGTMISLIPAMGTRVLGLSWISESHGLLSFILSIITFFGAIFLTICFLLVFNQMFQGRRDESVSHHIVIRSKHLVTIYAGDMERSLLLICLVPMWFGILSFYILLMPLIPSKYSEAFAIIALLVIIPLVVYTSVGWYLGKRWIRYRPGNGLMHLLMQIFFALIVTECIILGSYAYTIWYDDPENFSPDIGIRAEQPFYSPHISSAKGIHLEITNLSTRQFINSRHSWSANYGYFIRYVPATAELVILGNPVLQDNERDIYWTWSPDTRREKEDPVQIRLQIYAVSDNREVSNSSLYLTWFDTDIVQVNSSYNTK